MREFSANNAGCSYVVIRRMAGVASHKIGAFSYLLGDDKQECLAKLLSSITVGTNKGKL